MLEQRLLARDQGSEPGEVVRQAAAPPMSRNLVLDFSRDEGQPNHTVVVKSWQEVRDQIRAFVAQHPQRSGPVVWTIAGQGAPGVFDPGQTLESDQNGALTFVPALDASLLRIATDQRAGAPSLARESPIREELKAIREVMEVFRVYLRPGDTLELVGCEVSQGREGDAFGRRLAAELNGAGLWLYDSPVRWRRGQVESAKVNQDALAPTWVSASKASAQSFRVPASARHTD